MNSKLFSFRVARPIENTGGTLLEFTYDPQSQTSVWNGNGAALASYYCTNKGGFARSCSAYGHYCTTGGGYGGKMMCDGSV